MEILISTVNAPLFPGEKKTSWGKKVQRFFFFFFKVEFFPPEKLIDLLRKYVCSLKSFVKMRLFKRTQEEGRVSRKR